MRIAARKKPNAILPRRERLMKEHVSAAALKERFPGVEQLRIELLFVDPNARSSPSPQMRTLYSSAPAFFRFACPCADCDGDFDLTDAVTTLIANGAGRKRPVSLDGHLSCQGVRFRDHAVHQASCQMQVSYQLRTETRLSA
jgi:hypothetical protein